MAQFEYEVKRTGPQKQIIVYKDGVLIYQGVTSTSSSIEELKQDAIVANQDNYPGIENMVLKSSSITEIPQTKKEEQIIPQQTDAEPVKDTQPEQKYKFAPPSNVKPASEIKPGQLNAKHYIYQKFKPTLVLDELSLPSSGNSGKQYDQDNTVGIEYPLIKINGYIFSKQEIDNLTIDCTGFLPKLTLQVTVTNDRFISKEIPKDGDIVSIAIRNKNDLINIIRNDYVITGAPILTKSTSGKTPTMMTFFGELFVPGLKSNIMNFAVKGTSMDFFKKLARILQLGFATNEDDTDDNQVWVSYQSPIDMIDLVGSRVWKDEQSFFDLWIDIYYNLNFVNLNKQLLSSEDEVDFSASLNNINGTWVWGDKTKQEEVIATPKVFSNYFSYKNTSFYIDSWRPINRSSAITFEWGTSIITDLFEHNQKLYQKEDSQKQWKIDIAPIYDKKKLNTHILLRGRSTYDPSTNKDLAQANYNYSDIYKKTAWMGIQYTLTNPNDPHSKWDGNHHKNYLRAQVHNTLNLNELDKLNVEINVQGTNMNLMVGDKVPVVLIKDDPIEIAMIHKKMYNEALDFFYCGYYIVKGYTISYVNDFNKNEMMSSYSQSFILTRREWPTPVPIEPISIS